jgi:Glycerol uptake facilitator and related permeases (Major Intrinsic Protein Family)
MTMFKRLSAELLGTFWLVLGGCGSAVVAANFGGEGNPLGIGLLGVSLAFGLTVLTGAYALGHISGGHFNPAVSIGLWAGGRFQAADLLPYILAQVLGGALAGLVLYLIASGQPGFTLPADTAGAFASNGYGALSPGGYSMTAALISEITLTAMFLIVIMGATDEPRAGRICPACHRAGTDLDPSDLHPGNQYLGQPGPFHRRGTVCRQWRAVAAMAVLAGADHRRGDWRQPVPPSRPA